MSRLTLGAAQAHATGNDRPRAPARGWLRFISRQPAKAAFAAVVAVLAGLATSAAHAQSAVSWSSVAPATSGTVGGTGTWNTTDQNWWTGATAAAWNNAANDTAVFAGTSGTVTLGTNITAGGFAFNTTGYHVNAGSNTLTLNAASSVLSLNASLNTAFSGTISGLVAGTGNVRITGGGLASGVNTSTLNLIGTATGGWSGTTTIDRGQTLALSATNQALRSTAAINLVNGNLTVTSASTTAGLDRIGDVATITVNTGSLTYTTVNNAANYVETVGSVALGRGELVANLSLTQSTGTQTLTLGGLTRSGGSASTASIRFIGAPLDTTRNRVVVTAASGSGTNSGQIIGPWAMVGSDYAVYDGSSYLLAANITATNESSWTTASSAYTANAPQTLGATRSIAALRYSGTLAANTSGTAITLGNFNLETNGILAPVGGGTASTLSIAAGGSGAIRTPATDGNLYIATTIAATGTGVGTNRLRIDAPITDNGSTAVRVVKAGPGILELTGANTFSGGLVLNGGVLVAATDSVLGAASGGITVDGIVQIYADTGIGAARTIQVNDGAVAGFYAPNSTTARVIAGPLTGPGTIRDQMANGGNVQFSSAGNTFSGPVVMDGNNGTNGTTFYFTSLGDGADAQPMFLGGPGSNTTQKFVWTGAAQTFTNRQFILTSNNAGNTVNVSNNGTGGLTITKDLGVGSTLSRNLTLGGTSTGFSNEFQGRIGERGGSLNVTKADAGTWILSATNTYTGTTTLTAGDLVISTDANISGTSSPLVFNGGTLKILGTSLTSLNSNRSTTFTAAKAVGFNIVDAANTFTVDQPLNQTTGGLTKTGAGTLYLTGSNTYTGATTAIAGTLRLAGGNQIADAGTVTLSGGSLRLDASESIGGLNVTAGGTVSAAAGATLTSGAYSVSNPLGSTVTLSANLSGTGSMTISGAGDVTLSGNNSFSRGLTISGGGNITLSGSNSYSGGTVLSGTANSVVILGDDNALGSGMVSFAVNSNDAATLRASKDVTIANSGTFAKYNGSLTVDGTNSIAVTGTWINGQGTDLVNNLAPGKSLMISEFISGWKSANLHISGSGNTTFNRLITGTITPVSSGTWAELGVEVKGTGATTITETLAPSNGITLSDSARLVIGPSAVMLTQANGVFESTFTGGISGASNSQTLEFASNLDSTLAGALSGTFSLLKTGSGTLTLSGTNSGFYGGVTLSGGRLNLNQANALSSAGRATFTISSGTIDSATAITLGNPTQAWNGSFTFLGTNPLNLGTGTVTLGTSPVVTVESSTLTIGGPIKGGFGLTKQGMGTLRLNGTSTYTGDTLVSSGTLMLGSNLALQTSGLDTSGGGVLATSGTAINAPTLGGVIGSTDLASEFVAADYGRFASLTLNPQAGKTYSYSGVIANGTSTGMTLTKSGPGTQVLSGLNTYTGKTTIADGTLQVGSIGNGGAASTLGQNATVDFGTGTTSGILRYAGSGETTSRVFNLADSTGGGGIVSDGSGPLVFSSGFTASGSGSRVFILGGSNTGTNQLVSIAGSGVSVNKTGPGLWRLTAASSYDGRLSVLDGTVVVAASVAGVGFNSPFGGQISGTLNPYPLIGDSAVNASGTVALLAEGVSVARGVFVATGSGSQTVVIGGIGSGTATFTNASAIRLGRGVTLQASTGGRAEFWNTWEDLASGTNPAVAFTVGSSGNAGTVAFNRDLPNSATALNVVNGTAQLMNNSDRIYPATPVTVGSSLGAATLDLNGFSQSLSNLSFAGNSGSVTTGTAAGGMLRLVNSGSLSVSGTGHVISAAMALDDAASFNVASGGRLRVTGAIATGSAGDKSLTKSGAGILELSGANTYAGTTAVSQGTLVVNGSLGGGSLSVAAAARLMGSGTIGGAATIAGIHAPGNSPGIETFASNLTYSGSSSQVIWELWGNTDSNSPLAYDQIVVGGTLNFADPTSVTLDFGGTGVGSVDWNDPFWGSDQTWTLFDVAGTTSNFGSFSLLNTPAIWLDASGLAFASSIRKDNSFSVTQQGSDVLIQYTVVVPEPAALALAAIGIAATAWAARRRR